MSMTKKVDQKVTAEKKLLGGTEVKHEVEKVTEGILGERRRSRDSDQEDDLDRVITFFFHSDKIGPRQDRANNRGSPGIVEMDPWAIIS
jgi:hypothetical protein